MPFLSKRYAVSLKNYFKNAFKPLIISRLQADKKPLQGYNKFTFTSNPKKALKKKAFRDSWDPAKATNQKNQLKE